MEKIITERWTKMNYTIHCLGFALTPRFYDHDYLETPAPGGVARKAPNQDKEVVTAVLEAFEKIAENEKERKLLREQFATFHTKKGIYSMQSAQVDVVTMDAIDWWSTYGSETPELAKKVLSQPISSSSAERAWSTYFYIHNVKRNKLNCARADKLVFIHSNIRLLSRFSDAYKNGPFKKWDINPNDTSLEESSTRIEMLRWELDDEISIPNEEVQEQRQLMNQAAAKSTSRETEELKLAELKELAKSNGVKGYSKLKKGELIKILGYPRQRSIPLFLAARVQTPESRFDVETLLETLSNPFVNLKNSFSLCNLIGYWIL
ncbi:hypothetical protein RIF29_40371 [Crotalaria pallida]|uniref:Rho termination factor-like N-terminal domain-containing protein n=1 Tax=Crotalaria pallida TaxID=3830 RepID=A0AAN9E3J7_CROPI